jgi:uncharacterized protein YjbI with pentapeptide repeats
MEPTIPSGKHFANMADLAQSRFEMVNLEGAEFEDVNLGRASFHDINMSDVSITAAQIGGARFKHIGPPPGKDGKHDRQRAVSFEEMQLCDSTFRDVDLSNVSIVDCNISGMTIDGVLVTEMMAAYNRENGK